MSGRKSPDTQVDPPVGGIAIDYSGGDQEFTKPIRGVYISTAGNLSVEMTDGTTVTFENLNAGQDYPRQISKIFQTGSTAAGVALY